MTIRELQEKVRDALNGVEELVKGGCKAFAEDVRATYDESEPWISAGKVAVVGVGMKTHAGLAAKFFNALSDAGINVLMISTSEIRIAALVPLDQLDDAVRALHTAYGLDADQVEAVVYGGTGR